MVILASCCDDPVAFICASMIVFQNLETSRFIFSFTTNCLGKSPESEQSKSKIPLKKRGLSYCIFPHVFLFIYETSTVSASPSSAKPLPLPENIREMSVSSSAVFPQMFAENTFFEVTSFVSQSQFDVETSMFPEIVWFLSVTVAWSCSGTSMCASKEIKVFFFQSVANTSTFAAGSFVTILR